jgi:outer membrane murein-binding lipoprotein Lpp
MKPLPVLTLFTLVSSLNRALRSFAMIGVGLLLTCLTSCKDRNKIRSDIAEMREELLGKRQQLTIMEKKLEALSVRENNAASSGGGNSRIQELEARVAKLELELEQVKTEESVAKQAQADAVKKVADYKTKYLSNP